MLLARSITKPHLEKGTRLLSTGWLANIAGGPSRYMHLKSGSPAHPMTSSSVSVVGYCSKVCQTRRPMTSSSVSVVGYCSKVNQTRRLIRNSANSPASYPGTLRYTRMFSFVLLPSRIGLIETYKSTEDAVSDNVPPSKIMPARSNPPVNGKQGAAADLRGHVTIRTATPSLPFGTNGSPPVTAR
jgi:hypothetical protein